MNKFQFFLLVEAVLLVLGLATVMRDSFSAFILVLAILLILIRLYNSDKRGDILLSASLLLLLFILMLNPYIITMIVLAVVYVMINHFSQVKKKNRYALVQFRKADVSVKPIRHQWIGTATYENDTFAFEDVNVIRIFGSDIIDLSQVIVKDRDNVVMIQKVYGPTKIIVPIDVAVKLTVSSIYGSVRYFDFEEYDLRNESIHLERSSDRQKVKQVKIVVNIIAGEVEVLGQ